MSERSELEDLLKGYVTGQRPASDLYAGLRAQARASVPDAPRATPPRPVAHPGSALPQSGGNGRAAKAFRGGTHRVIAPDETVARVRPLMAAMGITRIANVTGLDCIGMPVVMVCRPNSRSLAVSQGKGLDLAAAEASGLMESVELNHAEHITLPLKLASYQQLSSSHRLVAVNDLPRVTASPFHANLPLLWIEGHDLLRDELVWLPYEMVHTDFTLPMPTGTGCFLMSSNGLASGNHPLEAISHAICEVVERDAWTLWSLLSEEARRRTRIDLETVDDANCRAMLTLCEQAAITVVAWEMTSDVGIPTFRCQIAERSDDPLRALFAAVGMGCHPTRGVALLRALTEAAQSRLTAIAGSRDDMLRSFYEQARSPDKLQQLRSLGEGDGPLRSFQDTPTWDADTFEEDLAWELERLRSVGIAQVVVVELTKPEFGIPVARVVIPGLEGGAHFSQNYQHGARARAFWENQA